ncbi:unnamed protein product [Cladocopium goreaui]|uniref:Rho guanine nucleotide exchange factor 3 n=1 Tax=Cladocopium goreaui TaxID=2562237 RepID=A0A9P1C608_9DINO|nr:unnamed protein product [Cladocopium goreaui]
METEKGGIIIGRGLPIETEKSGVPFLPRSENLEETEKGGIIIPRGLPTETEKSGVPFLPRSENLEETEKGGIIIGRGLPIETEKSGAPFLPRSENLEETEKSGFIIPRGLPIETEKSGAPFLPRSENLEETEKRGIIIFRGLPIETEKSGAPFLPRSENLEETEKGGIIIFRGLPIETEKSGAPFLPRSENLGKETEKSREDQGMALATCLMEVRLAHCCRSCCESLAACFSRRLDAWENWLAAREQASFRSSFEHELRWTPLQVAQLPGEKERICCAPPFNMAAEPKWATHGTIAVLVVALLILLPKMTTGNHHHQFDGHGIALDYVDLASPYVMDEPNSASETSSRRDLKWEAEEAEDLAGFGEMESAYSEALVVYEDYMETIFESCGCSFGTCSFEDGNLDTCSFEDWNLDIGALGKLTA